MSFFDDVAKNVSNFFNGGSDEEKKRRAAEAAARSQQQQQTPVAPTSTLRQSAIAPLQGAMINVPQAGSNSNQVAQEQSNAARVSAELERQRQEEARRNAQAAVRTQQIASPQSQLLTVPMLNTPQNPTGKNPINTVNQDELLGLSEQDRGIVTQWRAQGKVPKAKIDNYIQLAKEGNKLRGQANYENSVPGRIIETARQVDTDILQGFARVPETILRSAIIEPLVGNATNLRENAVNTDSEKNTGIRKFFYGEQPVQSYQAQARDLQSGVKSLTDSDTLANLAVFSAPVLAALDLATRGNGKAANTAIKDAVKSAEKEVGRKLTDAEKATVTQQLEEKITEAAKAADNPTIVNTAKADEQPGLTGPSNTDNSLPPISLRAVDSIAKGNAGASVNILRNSGRNLIPDAEKVIAEELKLARTPEEVKAVLAKYGIPVEETPAEFAARKATENEAITKQANEVNQSAPQEFIPQENVPTQATPQPGSTSAINQNPDVAQNNAAFDTPQVSKTDSGKTFYHGTSDANIKSLKDLKAGSGVGKSGRNRVYVTENPEIAKNFGKNVVEEKLYGKHLDVRNIGIEKTPGWAQDNVVSPEFADFKTTKLLTEREKRVFENQFVRGVPNNTIIEDTPGIHKYLASKGYTTITVPRTISDVNGIKSETIVISDKAFQKPTPKPPVVDPLPTTPKTEVPVPETPTPKPKAEKAPTPTDPAYSFGTNEKTGVEELKIIGKGKAAEGLGEFQGLLEKAGAGTKALNTRYIDSVEIRLRNIEDSAPEIGQFLDRNNAEKTKAIADSITQKNVGTQFSKEVLGGNLESQNLTKYLVENMSNTKKLKKYEGTPEYEAAQKITEHLQGILPDLNKMLVEYGEKPIGTVKDYFPRMAELNKKKDINETLRSIMESSADGTGALGEARITKGFMKTRENVSEGKTVTPYEAMVLYTHQAADVMHLTGVVKRMQTIKEVIDASDNLPTNARAELSDFLTTQINQVANRGVNPTSGLGIVAKGITGIASRSQIMFSVNAVLAQVANPVTVIGSLFRNNGFIKGTADSFALAKNTVLAFSKTSKNGKSHIQELQTIDGMQSDYLVTARGVDSSSKNPVSKLADYGYRVSNLGDLQTKNAAVVTFYERFVKNGEPRGPETLHKAEREARMAIGDRTMGERSKFTASDNPLAILAAQYQIEQIANVMNFVRGTILSKRVGPWNKFAGTIGVAGAAYGANEATSAATGGLIQPLPDIIGASIDAYGRVQERNEQRIKNGEDPFTPEQLAGLFMTNMSAAFVSNLPLGRTVLAPINATVEAVSKRKDAPSPGLADDLGLSARDTNPLQTLPAIGVLGSLYDTGNKALSDPTLIPKAAGDFASKLLPAGGQVKKTITGVEAFFEGGQSRPDVTDQNGVVTPGDKKFNVENDLGTVKGWRNLLAMSMSGAFANPGGKEYLTSGFKSQAERDIQKGNITAENVKNLTEDQYKAYVIASNKQFAGQLQGDDKKVFTTMQDNVLLNRNLAKGTISQDKVDDLKAQKNRYLYGKGLYDQIDTGYTKEETDKFTPEVQAYIMDKAISGRSLYKDESASEATKAVLTQAFSKDTWPTVDVATITPTNALAEKWVTYQKALGTAGTDQAAQFDARKKFWSATVKQAFDSKAVGVYDSSDDGGSTNAKGTYAMSVTNIRQLASEGGLTVGESTYKINKKDLDQMIELDNRLVKAGLISKPKFTNKVRGELGYGDAPLSGIEDLGYDGPKANSRTGRGKGGTNPETLLTNFGGRSGGSAGLGNFKSNNTGQVAQLDIGSVGNRGSKSGKSSIQIKL